MTQETRRELLSSAQDGVLYELMKTIRSLDTIVMYLGELGLETPQEFQFIKGYLNAKREGMNRLNIDDYV